MELSKEPWRDCLRSSRIQLEGASTSEKNSEGSEEAGEVVDNNLFIVYRNISLVTMRSTQHHELAFSRSVA